MSATAWQCPIGCDLKGQRWISLPNSYKYDPKKIDDKVEDITRPRFEKFGLLWSELPYNAKLGVSIAATLILAASTPYVFVTGILLGGTVLACCIIGKNAAETIKKNEMKKCCFEFEDFLATFKQHCENFLRKIDENTLTSEEIQDFQKLLINDVSFEEINRHLESLELKLSDVYEDRLPFSQRIYELSTSTGYFLASFEGWKNDLEEDDLDQYDLANFKELTGSNLKGEPVKGNLGLILHLTRVHANVQAFRCGL